jgi:hypothetical protein
MRSIVFGVMHEKLGLRIVSYWVLSQRGCLSKELGLAIVHSDFFVKNWIHF